MEDKTGRTSHCRCNKLLVRDGGVNLQQEVVPHQTERPPRDSSTEDTPDKKSGVKCNIQADGGRDPGLSEFAFARRGRRC
jgi:hypothetical protein